MTLLDAHSCHVRGEDTIGETVLSRGHLGDIIRLGLGSEPIDKVLMRIALEMDHVAAFGEEFAVLARISDRGQRVEVRLHKVHSLLDLIEWAQLIKHELFGLDLLLCDGRHVLVR